jgi:hypothetical protein
MGAFVMQAIVLARAWVRVLVDKIVCVTREIAAA